MSTNEEKTPEEMRAEIDRTRGELGDTVAAVAEKTDVKKQAQDKVQEVKAQTQEKVEDVKAQAATKTEEAKRHARTLAEERPAALAIGAAVAVLFVLWRLLRR